MLCTYLACASIHVPRIAADISRACRYFCIAVKCIYNTKYTRSNTKRKYPQTLTHKFRPALSANARVRARSLAALSEGSNMNEDLPCQVSPVSMSSPPCALKKTAVAHARVSVLSRLGPSVPSNRLNRVHIIVCA